MKSQQVTKPEKKRNNLHLEVRRGARVEVEQANVNKTSSSWINEKISQQTGAGE